MSRDHWLGALLAALLGAAYLLSPVRVVQDSKYLLLQSRALVGGSWDLGPFVLDADGQLPIGRKGLATPWQLIRVRGEVRYFYPPGSSIAAIPAVALASALGHPVLDERGRFDAARERRLHGVLASIATAALGWLVFRLARREVGPAAALSVALAAGLGSSLWSVASRVLSSQTLEAAIVGGTLLELLRWEDGARRRPWLLASLLVAGFWIRPTTAVLALGVTLFVALRHRMALPALLAGGAAGLASFVGWSLLVWGAPLPPYYSMALGTTAARFFAALAGQLVSPGRGLFVFHPVLLLALGLLTTLGVPKARRAPALLVGGVVAAELLLYACWRFWWGGGSYGPRLLVGLVPALAWLGALAWRAVAERPRRLGAGARIALATAALLLVGAGVFEHGLGALSRRAAVEAMSVGANLTRPAGVWKWSHQPALRYLRRATRERSRVRR